MAQTQQKPPRKRPEQEEEEKQQCHEDAQEQIDETQRKEASQRAKSDAPHGEGCSCC